MALGELRGNNQANEGVDNLAMVRARDLEETLFRTYRSVKRKYPMRLRMLVLNLQDSKNPGLRSKFINGVISPEVLAKMEVPDMANDELKAERAVIVKETIRMKSIRDDVGILTSSFTCEHCGSHNCAYSTVRPLNFKH